MVEGLVSIITPTYNHEKFLESCLDSVIAQTYSHWEVIIIDDGSTDNTAKIASGYASKHNNIHYIYQDNIGPYRLHESYNKALQRAEGEYVAILEGDDFWSKNKLELQINAFKQNPSAVLCWSAAKSVHAESLEVIREHPPKEKDRSLFNNNPVGSILNTLYVDNCIPALTIIMKSVELRSIGGFQNLKNLPLVDYPTILELSTKGTFIYIEEFLGYWRMYPTQVTKTHTVNIKKGLQHYANEHYTKLKKQNHRSLNKINWQQIKKLQKDQMLISYARAGRYKLIQKDFKGAREEYLKSLSIGYFNKPVWKLRSVIGIVFSFLKTDVEGLAGILGKTSYKKN